MTGRRTLCSLIALAFTFCLLAIPATHGVAGDGPELTGAKKCGMCHKKEEDGAQLAQWEASAHAKAYESLASEKSLAAAKELGIDNPQTSDKCLRCHVTAFPVMADLANQKITLEEGVSCESCHGAGGDYYKKATMEGITAGTIKAADVGLVYPTAELCITCHNAEGNPFHKEFDFDAYVAKVAHPKPAAPASGK